MFSDGLLGGKRILVTGGGSGLGRAMAEAFLALGANVVIAGRRLPLLKEAAAEMMAAHGGQVDVVGLDIRDPDAVEAVIAGLWDQAPLTGLVNNAAGNFISRTEDLSPNGFNAIASTVMQGTFYVTHAVGKRWIADGLPLADRRNHRHGWGIQPCHRWQFQQFDRLGGCRLAGRPKRHQGPKRQRQGRTRLRRRDEDRNGIESSGHGWGLGPGRRHGT